MPMVVNRRSGPAPSTRAASRMSRSSVSNDGDGLAHVERTGHEADREHDGRGREDDVDLERVEDVGEQADAARERRQQPDAGDGRRQHERELDERDHERPAAEAPRAEEVRGGRPEQQDDHERHRVRRRGECERIAHDRIVQLIDQQMQGHAGEDRDDRQHEKAEHREGRDEEHRAEGGAAQAAHVTSHPCEKNLCI